MPPRAKPKGKGKGKGKKGKGKTGPPVDPCPQFQMSETNLVEKEEMDLLNDLNDDFFAAANKTIQMLMEGRRTYEASKLKKYSDIIYNLHNKYEAEVKETTLLRPQIVRAEHKLRLALELTIQNQEAFDLLRGEIESAWFECDASYMREQEAQERIQELMVNCKDLDNDERDRDEGADLGPLAKYKNIILRERDRLNGEVLDLDKRLQFQRFYSESLEYINQTNEERIAKLSSSLRAHETEKANFEGKIRSLMANMEEQKEHNLRTLARLESANRELSETQNKLSRKTADFDNLKLVMEKLRSDYLLNLRQLGKNETEINELRRDQSKNEEIIRTLRLEDKVKANTISQLTKKFKKAMEDYSAIASKLYKLNRANFSLGEDIARLKNQIHSLEKDLITSLSKYEELRILKENIQRERDTSRSDIVKLNNTIADLRHTIVLKNIHADGLNLDIKKLNKKLDEARGDIAKAEAERDEMMQEVDTLNLRIENYQEQIELKTNQVNDLTEKLQQKHFQLVNVKKQLETVYSEKMALKRSLETCTQERDNFRVLQAKTNHQIAQLSTEIAANQNKINNLKLQIEKLNNDKKDLQTQLKHRENLLASLRKELRDMKNTNENLLKTIRDDEIKFIKMAQELQNSEKKKNLIGLQMVRRNDEIITLRSKMSIMQTAIDQGSTQYNQRVQDINILKLEIKELQRLRDCQAIALKSDAEMRSEIIRLQRALNQERTRVRSLTEDAKTPTGVHRWRILRGADPERYELLEKVQTLQRRHLKDDLVTKDLKQQLEEKQGVADKLKRIVENLPTASLRQKLVAAQRANRIQENKLKVLKAECYMNGAELKAYICMFQQIKENMKAAGFEMGDISSYIQKVTAASTSEGSSTESSSVENNKSD